MYPNVPECKCDKCRAIFKNEIYLVSVHEGIKQHKCNKCSSTFDNEFNLENHIVSIHERKSNMIAISYKFDKKIF